MIEKLIDFGMTQKEAEVYLALMQGGEQTADQLAKSSKLNRSTAYVQIKILTDYGLVSTFKRGKKTFFAAESPNNLVRILEKKHEAIVVQKAEISQLVPELLKLYGNAVDRPAVRVFEGKEGLITMRNDILDTNSKIISVVFSFDGMSRIFTDEELMAYSRKRAGKKIISRALYTKTGPDIPTVPPQQILRVQEKDNPFGSDIYIYGDTISFASTKDQIVGVTIKNSDIANTMLALFEIAWKQAGGK